MHAFNDWSGVSSSDGDVLRHILLTDDVDTCQEVVEVGCLGIAEYSQSICRLN